MKQSIDSTIPIKISYKIGEYSEWNEIYTLTKVRCIHCADGMSIPFNNINNSEHSYHASNSIYSQKAKIKLKCVIKSTVRLN